MNYIVFEEKLRSAVPVKDIYASARLLPGIPPEKRILFLAAIQSGYSLSETILLCTANTLHEQTVLSAIQHKMQDNASELRA